MAAAVRPRSFLSTPSARRATITDRAVRYLQTISIHALREEGDVCAIYDISELISFLSTPSARRATERSGPQEAQEAISIHALREEGDPRRQHRRPAGLKISIHALREEGDAEFAVLHQVTEISIHALREEGDRAYGLIYNEWFRFLSTPSARRATRRFSPSHPRCDISIHALREEGDSVTSASATRTADFYPRPPRGGRPSPNRGPSEANDQFLSTPSARRATWCVSPGNTSSRYFYPRPPRGGRLPSMDRRIL